LAGGDETKALSAEPDPVFGAIEAHKALLSLLRHGERPRPLWLLRHGVHDAVPAIYEHEEFAAVGGLMSYGGSLPEAYRLTGVYVGRILKGENPADLPIQQSTKVELTINLKAAETRSPVPETLLAMPTR
jgi:putative ABC transport system substrate-binding protein